METIKIIESNDINPQNRCAVDDDEQEVWQDLLGIVADPPDQREKCEHCR